MSEKETMDSLKIERLDPSSAKVGWEGPLSIGGTGFGDEISYLRIDDQEVKIKSWASEKILVEITKSITKTAGKKPVLVHVGGDIDTKDWIVEE